MKKNIGKFTAIFMAVSILITSINITNVSADPAVMFESKENGIITKNVTYESVRQVTTDGFRDIYVLKIPIGDPNVSLGVAESKKEYGLKETVKTLLGENGAVAGVNGDYFGTNGTHSMSFGPTVSDGEFISVSTGFNKDKNKFAAFYIEDKINPFIIYTKTEIDFLNDGKENMEVYSINKISDMVYPVLLNRKAMNDTALLDKKFPGLLKIVVDNSVITKVSSKGETVEIPENGYIIAIQEASADYFGQFYKVGQTAELRVRSGVDFNKISTSIGGASRILLEGEIVRDGLIVEGRQPRTSVGITKDKKQIILMVVDGRGHSIGATHNEMAQLLKAHGAFNAMHLDGGGSSTMAVKTVEDKELKMVNTPSDGAPRKVVNALGVYNKSTPGVPSQLKITTTNNENIVYKGIANKINVRAQDEYYNNIEIPKESIVISTDDGEGKVDGEYFYPSKTGNIHVMATYGNIIGEVNFTCRKLVELKPNITSIKLSPGEKTVIMFQGIDETGKETFINDGVTYEVVPPSLGHMDAGTFIANSNGSGYIKCSIGDVFTYIPVAVGSKTTPLYSFEGEKQIKFIGYPTNVKGKFEYSTEKFSDGAKSAKLTYSFPTLENQAAYGVFTQAYELPGTPSSLELDVFGNNSPLWLSGKLKDANGKEILINFTKNIDWTGWKTIKAQIPNGVKYPVYLEGIYVTSVSASQPLSCSIYIDNLKGIYPIDGEAVQIPPSSKYVSPDKASLSAAGPDGSFDITALPKMNLYKEKDKKGNLIEPEKPSDYSKVQNNALSKFKKNTKRGLYVGDTDLSPESVGIPVYKWNPGYIMHSQDNVGIVQMAATNGGFFNTNKEQWQKFSKDIENSGKKHIIITVDKNPLNFKDPKELELFNDELVRLKNTGKTVFVVSADGQSSSESNKDGITYINIGSLWTKEEKSNRNFKMARFRVNGDNIQFELQGN